MSKLEWSFEPDILEVASLGVPTGPIELELPSAMTLGACGTVRLITHDRR